MSRLKSAVPAILLAAGAILVLATFRDYGITWDETVQVKYGEQVLDYFRSGFRDTRCNELTNMRNYGPLFDLSAALLSAPWPRVQAELRHLLNAVLGLAAVAGTYRLGRRLLPPGWAILGALFLATLPRFYGDAFNNPKDIPFACAFVWFVDSFAGVMLSAAPSWRRLAGAGLALGFVGAARPGGLPLALLVSGAAVVFIELARRFREGGEPATGIWKWIVRAAVATAIAWVVMIAPWPWAHENPIANPIRAMREASRFSETYDVLYRGEYLPSNRLPRSYALNFLGIATPLGALGFALAGFALAVRKQLRDPRSDSSAALFLLQAWFVIPLGLFVVLRPNVYDGIRHFLFLLPALAILAAYGAFALYEAAPGASGRALAATAVALALLLPAVAMARLHPYQTTYFNALVGGVRGASGRYETDYWASAYKEAAEWINAHRDRNAPRPTTVLIAANPYSITCASYYLDEGIDARRYQARGAKGPLPANTDFYIGTTRWGLDRNFPDSPVVFRVERAGATFAVVRGAGRQPAAVSSPY